MVLGVLKFMAYVKFNNEAAVCSKLVSVLGKAGKLKLIKRSHYTNI